MDISVEQWSEFVLPLTVTTTTTTADPITGSAVVVSVPVDLTDCTARGSVFKGWKAPDEYPFTFTFDPDPTTGKLTATMTADQAGGIPYGEYLFAIHVRNPAGADIFSALGACLVKPGRKPLAA